MPSFLSPPPLLGEPERLAWASHRHAMGDPLGGYILDAVHSRAWVRSGRQGPPPERVGPDAALARTLERQLEEEALALTTPDGERALDACRVHGGLVESVTADAGRFLQGAERLRQRLPLLHLQVKGPVGELLSSPALRGLVALDLRETDLDEAAARVLARNPAAAALRWLDLPALGPGAAAALASSPWLLGLRWAPLSSPQSAALQAVHGPRPWLDSGSSRPDWDLLGELRRTPWRIRLRELRHSGPGPDAPSLHDRLRERGEPDEPAIVDYLAQAPLLVASPGRVRDVLDPQTRAGSASVRTDGVYAWTEDLAHYVGRWHLRLPDELLQHGRALGWEIPRGLDVRSFS
jgi:hypothetical protein